jgi:hypothetical protein
VVFYDEQGAARAFGAETEDDEILYTAEAEGWRKAEWCGDNLDWIMPTDRYLGGSCT